MKFYSKNSYLETAEVVRAEKKPQFFQVGTDQNLLSIDFGPKLSEKEMKKRK